MEGRVCRGEKDFPEKVYQFSPDVKELYYKGNLLLTNSTWFLRKNVKIWQEKLKKF